ncbi:hypothetical protein [Arenibaculum pallidiluteum]|uniref:hypothetical protein n=1 Tax=Arenibaculum pallidiluteum TaxID=2812559 RepID=UPI001A95FC4F|nr:hypothetical protein [Arenibaculum pallidiluteum]
MTGRDVLIVLVLLAAALATGWPHFRDTNIGRLLSGRCEHIRGGKSFQCLDQPDAWRR